MGDCRRVALPAIFCLTSLVSLLFTIAYTNDRAMLHEAEVRAQAWLRLASRQLDRLPGDIGVVLAHSGRCQRKLDSSPMPVNDLNFMQRSTPSTPEALSHGWL